MPKNMAAFIAKSHAKDHTKTVLSLSNQSHSFWSFFFLIDQHWILEVSLRQDVFCRFHNRSGSFLHMDFTNCQKLDWEVSPSNKAPTERYFGCFPIDLFYIFFFERSSILSFKGCPNNEIKNLYNTHAKGRTYLLFSILLRFCFKHI